MASVNVVLAQGGGPTSVINGSLSAAIAEYQTHKNDKIGKIYVALHGADGLLKEDLVDVTDMSESQIKDLEQTICAASGSARAKLDDDAKRNRVIDVLQTHDVHVLNLIGGGDTASTVAEINKVAEKRKYDLISVHDMKTIDNDGYGLFSPGWGTCGLWQVNSTLSFIKEVEAMHGAILGVSMGRDSGWITAMNIHAFLAEGKDKRSMSAMYTPETGFTLERFTRDCVGAYKAGKNKLVVNVSEGVQEDGCDVSLHKRLTKENAANTAVLSTILSDSGVLQVATRLFAQSPHPRLDPDTLNRLIYSYTGVDAPWLKLDEHGHISYGEIRSVNLADRLAGYLEATMKESLGLKKLRVRGNTFGYMQRCPPIVSSLDLLGAVKIGKKGAEYALELVKGGGGNSHVEGYHGASIVLNSGDPANKYLISAAMQAEVVGLDRIANLATGQGIQYQMPGEFITNEGPTQAFIEHSRPLVTCDIIRADPKRFVSFTDALVPRVEKKLPAYKAT